MDSPDSRFAWVLLLAVAVPAASFIGYLFVDAIRNRMARRRFRK